MIKIPRRTLGIEYHSFPPQVVSSTALAGLTALGFWGWELSLGGGQTWSAADLAALLASELLAVSLGAFGLLSGSFPFFFRIGLVSPKIAGIGLGLGLMLRSLLKGHPSVVGRFLEFVSDFLPATLALGASHIAALNGLSTAVPMVGAGTYLLSWVVVPGLFSQSLDHEHLRNWGMARDYCRLQVLALGALAVYLGSLPSGSAGETGCVFLAAMGLVSAAGLARAAVESEVQRSETEDAQVELEHRQVKVQQVQKFQERTNKHLELRMETFALIQRLLQSLPSEPALKAVAHGIIEQVRIKIPCSSVALFWEEEGRLQPLAYITPHVQRLQQSMLTLDVEPVVHRAWTTSQPQRISEEERAGSRIFVGEHKAAAVPFPGKGALYIGDAGQDEDSYSDEQLDFLEALTEQGRLALDAAYFHQRQGEALAREATARSSLEAILARLSQLLEGLAVINRLQQPSKIMTATEALLQRLVSSDLIYLDFGQHSIGEPLLEAESQASVLEVLGQSQRPISFDDIGKSRFRASRPDLVSFLGAPVFSQDIYLGCIFLGSKAASAFSRADLDAVQVLTFELAGTIYSAQLYSELEQTHALLKESQAQLVQSSKMAAVGQLAGGVAHELNTPLGAISVAIDSALMNLNSHPDRSEARLKKAVISVEKMRQIVSKLLFYSREATFERQETDLNRVVEDTLELIGHQLHLDNIEVVTNLSPLPKTYANQNELQQILTNLLLNAKDAVLASDAPQRQIEIITSSQDNWLSVTVKDWGCGVPAELKERIFEPFFTTKEVGRGTGLGLSVTSQLVQQHQGTLALYDNQPRGSCFVFRLPVASSRGLDE